MSFLQRKLTDGLGVKWQGLYTRSWQNYYNKNIATSSIKPVLHLIGIVSVSGYTMQHLARHKYIVNNEYH